ncbi:MAG: SRPBCC family protein [Bacteroidota bacterium]
MKQASHKVQVTINAHPESVWELISSGKDVDKWLAPITSCRVEGNKRYCGTAEGEFSEDILDVDHDTWTFSYAIPEQHLLPITNIKGAMNVKAIRPDISIVTWSWIYQVDEAHEIEAKEGLTMVGNMGIKGIEGFVNKPVY